MESVWNKNKIKRNRWKSYKNLSWCFFQEVERLFVLAFDNTDNDNIRTEINSWRKWALPRVNITNCNVLIDSRNLLDRPIIDQIKKYDGVRKIETGQGDDYITGCLLDYKFYRDYYQLTAVDLSKEKMLIQKLFSKLNFMEC